ncbi:MAG TPA: autotransporter-associated beta strand repeat-containing protein [Chthoniobacteraceae bacterium]|nr:autotransporter-associated beta strand repeat-containing protein [Chthoniobacteraceae bacterium]
MTFIATGEHNDWHSTSNWLPGVVPALKNEPAANSVKFSGLPTSPTSRLYFNEGAGTYNVIDFTYDDAASILIRNGSLEGTTSTVLLNVTGDLTKGGNGNLRFHTASGGSIALKIEGDLTVNAGTVQVGSDFAVAQNLTIEGNTTINGGRLSMRLSTRDNAAAPIRLGNVNVKAGADLQLWEGSNSSTATQYFRASGLNGGGNVYITNLTSSAQKYSGSLEIDTATENNVFSGILSEKGGNAILSIAKKGIGSLTLSGSNDYSGTTSVEGGRLIVAHDHALGTGTAAVTSGTLAIRNETTVGNQLMVDGGTLLVNGGVSGINAAVAFGAAGGRLEGSGRIDVAIALDHVNRILAPGEGVGVQTFGENQAWTALTYEWEIRSWMEDEAGVGYDQIAILGGLDLAGSTEIRLKLSTLLPDAQSGPLSDFSDISRSWVILTTTAGIDQFDLSKWHIDADLFQNGFTGEWSLNQSGNHLVLSYAAIPEGSTIALLLAGGAIMMIPARRRG